MRGIWKFHLFVGALVLVSTRHFFMPGDHLWTDEGHHYSWNMRIRHKDCKIQIAIRKGEWFSPDLGSLTSRQIRELNDPYFFMQYVRKRYCSRVKQVFADIKCENTIHAPAALVDPEADLCSVPYSPFWHNAWITLGPGPVAPDRFNRRMQRRMTLLAGSSVSSPVENDNEAESSPVTAVSGIAAVTGPGEAAPSGADIGRNLDIRETLRAPAPDSGGDGE